MSAQVSTKAAAIDDLAIVLGARTPPDAEVGMCYRNALQFQQDAIAHGWTLVHGVAVLTGGADAGAPFGHAWVERQVGDDWWVFDPTSGIALPRQTYYLVGQISYTVRYSLGAAARAAVEATHYGPWDPAIAASRHNREAS